MLPINWVAVIISAVISMVIGFVWYGPLFSKPWMKEIGFTEKDVENGPGIGYLLTMIAAAVTAAVTSLLVHWLNVIEPLNGAFLGLILGLGYVATTFASNYIFGRKSMKLYLIDVGYQVLYIVATGIITTIIR